MRFSLCVALIAAGMTTANANADDKKPARATDLRAKALAEFDKDGDGKLNPQEREAAKAAFEKRRAEAAKNRPDKAKGRPDAAARRAEIIKKFDKDGDGKLNEQERAAAKKALGGQGGGADRRAALLKKFDKDGDGKLSDEEKAAAKKFFAEQRAKAAKDRPAPKTDRPAKNRLPQELLKKFDTDGDGKLSPEERKAAREAKAAKEKE